jgi:hypothetical protein
MTAIGSSTTSSAAGNSAQIAALEKQLVKYQKELQQDETPGAGVANAATAQLVATQITLVETEIAQLSSAGALASASAASTLGSQLDVTA